ncbi:signal transduction histidine kinase [Saccharothrix coeruleofusca]|uniref:sensor histidine kinase n=1 Tax=Saccharothrix coeruleofusca TaxID=33919 RepID=UPI001AE819EA|nr:sensor histidine kinase [Saccharothrix coeruleofusca]MBP2336770.1 signal transduction histidine kinase [Saccharothrix coeruleofusca]
MLASRVPPVLSGPRALVVAVLAAPARRRSWLATMHVATGALIGVPVGIALLLLAALTGLLAITVVLAAICLVAFVACVDVGTSLHRARFAAFLDVRLQRTRREAVAKDRGWTGVLAVRLREPATLRQIGYHLLILLLGPVSAALVLSAWVAGVALTLFAVLRLLSGGTAVVHPAALVALGLVALLAAPWVARGLAGLDVALARALLQRSARDVLAEKVESLVESRAGLREAADSERRRIERDLHDGTQQQLTSLALNLGIARQTLPDLSDPARAAIVAAHEDAKAALADLRNLVRGLHPAVLDERGLDAALAGVCARSPVPVALTVDVDVRPSAGIEAVAYFVVSESLTNIAKHARATRVEVSVRRTGGSLSIQVVDDGVGGAGERDGSGLRGLRQRVASVDGALVLDSPAGGGTSIRVELPCE